MSHLPIQRIFTLYHTCLHLSLRFAITLKGSRTHSTDRVTAGGTHPHKDSESTRYEKLNSQSNNNPGYTQGPKTPHPLRVTHQKEPNLPMQKPQQALAPKVHRARQKPKQRCCRRGFTQTGLLHIPMTYAKRSQSGVICLH